MLTYTARVIPFLSLVYFNLQTLIWKRCFLNKKKKPSILYAVNALMVLLQNSGSWL